MGSASNPCTGICKFDEGLCLSCGRLRSEKKQWKRLSKPQRKEVLARSAARIEALGERAILSKKQRKKAKRRAGKIQAASTGESDGMVVKFRPHEETAMPHPPAQADVVDAEAAKEARKAWKKARRHARKAKKAALKARAAEARARGASAA
ncbi:DUF1289 domain-containing protein [Ectothiorhodospiraceae bacterium WFHF3C12]|nr:DUF1289 domain-containing protein [Ectothiorhodospiraceae bacterium WFHF3C12]